MTLSYRPLKLLLPLALALSTEAVCSEFVVASQDDPQLAHYVLGVPAVGLVLALCYWRRLEPVVRGGLLLTLGYLLALVLEGYATHLLYIHVLSKVTVLLLVYGTYAYYRRYGLPPWRLLVQLLFGVLLLNLFTKHPEALSVRAFAEQERGFSATAALLAILPTLLCLNWFFERGRLSALLFFFVGLGLIVFLQHRSVWITTAVAMALNLLLLLWRAPSARFSLQRLLLLGLPVGLGLVVGAATIFSNPVVQKRFENNFDDITKADKQGTGNWRLKQMHAYQPLIAERPLLGWRQEGFELPVQFYDPSSDQPMWRNLTGHHFHSFYLDRLFYGGWLGLLLVVMLPFVQLVRRLAHPAPLSVEAVALTSLVLACLVFALSYDWPTYLYAFVGLMLAALARPAPVPTAAGRVRRFVHVPAAIPA